MRIRKRQAPFPLLSSLSPDPTVQLPLSRDPPPILSDDDDTAAYYNAPSSPHPQFQPIQLAPTQTDANLLLKDERSNDARGAKTDTLINNDQPQQGKWSEGEEAFAPLKKRRESSSNEKAKMKKKSGEGKGSNIGEEEKESKNGKKKGKRGGLMEGSRCSRVNGRGWRCWQQTLVGYSLCEHHLGKGRLRSMASVRSRSKAAAFDGPLENHKQEKPELSGEDLDGESGKSNRALKRKLGIVKARSMSSLLGQHNTN